MRILALMLLLAISAVACADSEAANNRRVLSDDDFSRSFVWSRATADMRASPTLAIARRGGLYPDAPDAELVLTCLPDGSVSVAGAHYQVATDVGGPPELAPRFSLKSNLITLSGKPIWQDGGFSRHAHFFLRPTSDQLRQLIDGDWFELVGTFADGSGTVRYPAPPRVLTSPFEYDCDVARRGR